MGTNQSRSAEIEAGQLVEYRGIDFRKEPARCFCCAWSGRAADLITPVLNDLSGPVRYACPNCSTIVATHVGLSDKEVMGELQRIRSDLESEISETLTSRDTDESVSAAEPDFATVRAQILVEDAVPASDDVADNEAASESPANEATASKNDLDFDAVRSRMVIG